MSQHYDAIIIGAGMSGMAAGIRLAMFGKNICILEKHIIPGGLNSYYQRGKRQFDVGLHALTNFATKGEKKKPLTKLLKQLRIPYSALKLTEQSFSKIKFPNKEINFSNSLDLLKSEIKEIFPKEYENFETLLSEIESFDEVNLENRHQSAKDKVREFIKDEDLVEMIFCPLLIYGSAWENDMDYSQFVIMFKSIFLEGFSRPEGGVRTIIDLLTDKLESLGVKIKYRHSVDEILMNDDCATGVKLSSGEILNSEIILSSIGHPETMKLSGEEVKKEEIGKLSFCESILCFDKRPAEAEVNETITFYNDREKYLYRKPEALFDDKSAVICFPNNFLKDPKEEGVIRITFMANYQLWKNLDKAEYKNRKMEVLNSSLSLIKKLYPNFDGNLQFHDVFTPTTITKYTNHFQGTVYESTKKYRDGTTHIPGLYIIGTDQGFLGIVGAMLSGISMANLHCLMKEINP